MNEKGFFVTAVRMVDIGGDVNIPTALFYTSDDQILIGGPAIAAAEHKHELLNEDFKVDLGSVDPSSKALREKFKTASGVSKSAVALTSDFVHRILLQVEQWIQRNAGSDKFNLLLAEPLSMGTELASSNWLSNYRRNLRRILEGRPSIEAVDFLPEPFAVFQYYRHGFRHPLITEKNKYNALVIDFGGGTFDVCIIETTREGDISMSGRNSKPLAASSDPIGGYYLNRIIAESLFRSNLAAAGKKKDDKLERGLNLYKRWRREPDFGLDAMSDEYRNFILQFHRVVHEVEHLKLALSGQIFDWRLDAPLTMTATIALPKDPYSEHESSLNAKFSASEFREFFVNKVWNSQLRQIVRNALQRGKQELAGGSVSVVLLSGGSANIGWLKELLLRDFYDELAGAEILPQRDYQEVVAKGLAVECARRFYSHQGDFASVTYNRLCLVLDPDERGRETKPFMARTDGLPDVRKMPGVLIPSASVLKGFGNTPIRWRVKLDHPPRHRLDYYFLRSSLDPDDTANLQNPGPSQSTALTPRAAGFDASIQVELVVRDDGTTIPTFVYAEGRSEKERCAVTGQPFYLDMTYGQSMTAANAYVGFDFGTSNSALSFVDPRSISEYRRRATESSWQELSELVTSLPYPLAIALEKYLGEIDGERLIERAREFTEAALAMAAYVTFLEYCAKGPSSKLLKGFSQRSAGPLWALLQSSLRQLRSNAHITAAYAELLAPEFYSIVDEFVNFIAAHKHDKAGFEERDHLRPVQILGNISHKVFRTNLFGFFEQVKKRKFAKSYEGIFRHACGPSRFIRTYKYQGEISFSDDQSFVVNLADSQALPLQPLMFWEHCEKHPDVDKGHCFVFDRAVSTGFSFKAAGYPCVCEVSREDLDYAELAKELTALQEKDSTVELMSIGSLTQLLSE